MKLTYAVAAAVLLTGCPPDRGACYAKAQKRYEDNLVRHCPSYREDFSKCPDYGYLGDVYQVDNDWCDR